MEEPDLDDECLSEDAGRALDLMSTPRPWPPLACREKGGQVIDLIGAPYDRLPAHRRMLLLLLQLEVRDRATEIRFEPGRFPTGENETGGEPAGFQLFYEVDGNLHELVPPPPHLMPDIAPEIESLAGLDGVRLRAAHLLRRIAGKIDGQEPGSRRGSFALRVADSTTDVEVLAYPGEMGERYFLTLSPISTATSETVGTEMRRIFERVRSVTR